LRIPKKTRSKLIIEKKERKLTATREKTQATYKGKPNGITADFSTEP
jgi:hypothetical protein